MPPRPPVIKYTPPEVKAEGRAPKGTGAHAPRTRLWLARATSTSSPAHSSSSTALGAPVDCERQLQRLPGLSCRIDLRSAAAAADCALSCRTTNARTESTP